MLHEPDPVSADDIQVIRRQLGSLKQLLLGGGASLQYSAAEVRTCLCVSVFLFFGVNVSVCVCVCLCVSLVSLLTASLCISGLSFHYLALLLRSLFSLFPSVSLCVCISMSLPVFFYAFIVILFCFVNVDTNSCYTRDSPEGGQEYARVGVKVGGRE